MRRNGWRGRQFLGPTDGSQLLALVLAARSPALAASPEQWEAVSTTASSITGNVRFSPDRITFQNGKSLPLEPAGVVPQFGEAMGTVSATLYRVTKPDDPALLQGTRLCGGKEGTPARHLHRRLETRPCCKRH